MDLRESPYSPIGDYAIVGDCRSAALVSRSGSIDWLCLPRFDSPSLFGALLDAERGGRFLVRPTERSAIERRYLGESNVLQTTFTTPSGRLQLTDAMPVGSEEDKRRTLRPDHEVLRTVRCVDGEVEVEVVYEPRPDYGRIVPRLVHRGPTGFYYEHRGQALILRSDGPLSLSEDRAEVRGQWTLHTGDRRHLSLTFAHGEPAVLPALSEAAHARLEATTRWWQDWSSRCTYAGSYRGAVVRSLLTLKLMTFAPSGAVVASPTTSLPEHIGGVRNWDYRYCWLRDASLTLQALFDLGYPSEGEAFLSWLLHTTRITSPELQVLYDVYGESRLRERELEHLSGYRSSRPVRIGNDAERQLQLDTYGEVIDAVYEFVSRGGRLDRATARLLVGLGKTIGRRWREPDEGIWERRAGRRQHTYSKVMCWVGLDRLLRLQEEGHLDAPREAFSAERGAIRDEVERRGYNADLESYVAVFGGKDVDASLLLLARYGYVEPDAPRMLGTTERIHERLRINQLLYRYREDDGLAGSEGAFGICSFWEVECKARQGLVGEATRQFEYLLSLANDVGLFAEEIDPANGGALGNFPQAFTHVGLIDAALGLEEERGESKRGGSRTERPSTRL